MEEQIKRSHETAQQTFESHRKDVNSVDLKTTTTLLSDSFNSEYEKLYSQTMVARPDMDSLMKQFEESRSDLVKHDVTLERKCTDILQQLTQTTWRHLKYKTLNGLEAYFDTESKHIWIVDTKKIRDGAYKPEEQDLYDDIIKTNGLSSDMFDYETQPIGFMFPL